MLVYGEEAALVILLLGLRDLRLLVVAKILRVAVSISLRRRLQLTAI